MTRDYVLLGLNDSATSHAAHQWAAQHAAAMDSTVRAVHVLEWPIGFITMSGKSGTRLQVPREEIAEPYWRSMHRVFGDIASPPGSTLQFAQGDAAEVLVRLSVRAELLVLGIRQPGRRHSSLAGQVSQYCITYAACPVVTVPAPPGLHTGDAAWADGNAALAGS